MKTLNKSLILLCSFLLLFSCVGDNVDILEIVEEEVEDPEVTDDCNYITLNSELLSFTGQAEAILFQNGCREGLNSFSHNYMIVLEGFDFWGTNEANIYHNSDGIPGFGFGSNGIPQNGLQYFQYNQGVYPGLVLNTETDVSYELNGNFTIIIESAGENIGDSISGTFSGTLSENNESVQVTGNFCVPLTTICNYLDTDNDGVADDEDNCPEIPNEDQSDEDGDGIGDACDDDFIIDTDDDGVADQEDNCPETPNADQMDSDGDGTGDVCDEDRDNDGVANDQDNCPDTANADQTDTDSDGLGDACDEDRDNDGVANENDNCPDTPNADQTDSDGNGVGDACEDGGSTTDTDGDGIVDDEDNCPQTPNENQADIDEDGIGDVCDIDRDGDGIANPNDNCPDTPNGDQTDSNGNGIGDACE